MSSSFKLGKLYTEGVWTIKLLFTKEKLRSYRPQERKVFFCYEIYMCSLRTNWFVKGQKKCFFCLHNIWALEGGKIKGNILSVYDHGWLVTTSCSTTKHEKSAHKNVYKITSWHPLHRNCVIQSFLLSFWAEQVIWKSVQENMPRKKITKWIALLRVDFSCSGNWPFRSVEFS